MTTIDRRTRFVRLEAAMIEARNRRTVVATLIEAGAATLDVSTDMSGSPVAREVVGLIDKYFLDRTFNGVDLKTELEQLQAALPTPPTAAHLPHALHAAHPRGVATIVHAWPPHGAPAAVPVPLAICVTAALAVSCRRVVSSSP